MEKLRDFVQDINEHRGRPKKNVEGIDPEQLTDKEKEAIAKKAKKAEKEVGKNNEDNEYKNFDIDYPYADGEVPPIPKEDYNRNMKRLKMKFMAKEPFFIQGKAGWGKTSIIVDMAKRHKLHTITVYLDKAVASDLGGIPVPVKGKDGRGKIVNQMPEWAAFMNEHPDWNFLLFFDEMNQASPDVMNALMPIVLKNVICNVKFNNFFVGAAGNFEEENTEGITELSGPLKSRFKPIIIWETETDEAWRSTFKYLHKKWDDVIGEELVTKFEEAASTFENPREIELKIFKYMDELKRGDSEEKELFDANDYLDNLKDLAKNEEKLTRTQKDNLANLAEAMYDFINSKESDTKKSSGRSSGRGKSIDMIDEQIKNDIKKAMRVGYIMGDDNEKYGISRENINLFCDPEYAEEPINAEMLDRLINKFEADGIKFKYEKNSDWKKAGLKDPEED